ncbi:hypothetical protein [Actinokineospora spheciospongiae]|uniref:hypothetical protein n=1 Tax=Actinokineospora spheciospongiae TaxID=909613 RepID=UPI000D9FC7DE|nr:hypothetical protein [Actinokineospora spheciospongiae]PWW62140.1 hypothetical protein DFQ13_106394 [Actinokineospora spheciospongiae]
MLVVSGESRKLIDSTLEMIDSTTRKIYLNARRSPTSTGLDAKTVNSLVGFTTLIRDFLRFIEDFNTPIDFPPLIQMPEAQQAAYVNNLSSLSDACFEIRTTVSLLDDPNNLNHSKIQQRVTESILHSTESAQSIITSIIDLFELTLLTSIDTLTNVQFDSLTEKIERFVGRSFTAATLSNLAKKNEEANQLLESTRSAAGETGGIGIAGHFEKLADRERQTANRLRNSSVSVLAVVGALAGVAVLLGYSPSSIQTSLLHIASFIPFGVLSAYLGRESSKHRQEAAWADEYQAQLLTFDAFVGPLESEDKSSLRRDFGNRVFVDPRPREAATEGPSTLNEMIAILEKLKEIGSEKKA